MNVIKRSMRSQPSGARCVFLLLIVLSNHLDDVLAFQPAPKVSIPMTPISGNIFSYSRPSNMASFEAPSPASFSLHAFGGGGFGIPTPPPPPPPITSKNEILRRLQSVLASTLRQFTSGWMSGYLFGSVWSLLRGPSITGASRGLVWGLDFGFLSAIFASTTALTQFVLDVQGYLTKQKDGGSSSASNKIKRQQAASLWSVVLRNVVLAIYFGRHSGLVKIARSVALYGGLTYYFVSQKMKRDTTMMSGGSTNINGMAVNPQSSAAMQELFRQMAARSGNMPNAPRGAAPPSNPSSSIWSTQPNGPSSSTSRKGNKPSPPQNVMDVEFETVEDEDESVP